MFWAIELMRDPRTKAALEEEHLLDWLSDQFMQRGIICRADDRLDPVIQFAPPLTTPRGDLDRIVAITAEVLHLLAQQIGSAASSITLPQNAPRPLQAADM